MLSKILSGSLKMTADNSPIAGATISIVSQDAKIPGVLTSDVTDAYGAFTCDSYTISDLGNYQFVAVYYP